ncbi:MAG TPA: bifunctional precorrin-2 dehydrogenase/sirohydrochlorin ferrochelatase [Terriglobales bacterium]|nr:bifunctional precorrin-2 dehydrogenase/sirohydrochlorin ferrochelatase [Terriglobales bacterium]
MFPIFLKLEGRRCLVVGAGVVGEGKVRGLLEARASVHVVAPQATAQIRTWAAQGALRWSVRVFEPRDLDGAFLVIVATPFGQVNQTVFHEARARGVLCNAVDDPAHCDFYYPAVVRRGDLQIAISTGGRSPALAQRLRRELEEQFGPEYEEWLKHLGEQRDELNALGLDMESRRRLLHEIASRRAFEDRTGRSN